MNRKDRRAYWKRNHHRQNLGSWNEYNELHIPRRPVLSKKTLDELFPAKIETENLEAK
jgi:hypothetical protein